MFLAIRDLRVGKGRFVLVGVVLVLIALMTTLLAGLATGLVDDGISGLRDLPLQRLAFQPGAQSTFSRSTLTDENLAPWKQADGLEVAPLGVSFANAKTASGDTLDIAIFGTPAGSFLAPSPEAAKALEAPTGIVLSSELEGEGVKVGDKVTIAGSEVALPVLGFTYSGSYGHAPIAFTSLATWQDLYYGADAHGRFSAIAIKGSADFDAIDAKAETATETKTQAYAGSPGYSAETATMSLIRGFLLVISALIVGAFFTVWTIQRTRQIGLLKALGASNAYVIRDALGQLAIVTVAATALGTLLAVGLGQFVGSGAPFHLEVRSVVTSAIVLVVVGLLGSLVAIRKVTKVDPIIALGSQN